MTAHQREVVYTPARKIMPHADGVLGDWKPDTSKGKSGYEIMHRELIEQQCSNLPLSRSGKRQEDEQNGKQRLHTGTLPRLGVLFFYLINCTEKEASSTLFSSVNVHPRSKGTSG